MSGYCGFSKSNNAVAAECDGRFPASVAAKILGGPTGFVRSTGTREWHHSSKYYSTVYYYDLEEIRELLATPEGQEELAKWKASQKQKETIIRTGCRVEWLEWGGTRNHPRATQRSAEGCTVVDEGGAFFKITLPDGRVIKKKKDCRGLEIAY